jgi:dihydroorotase
MDPAYFDVAILNGRVIDPESETDAVLNVGVTNGRIVALSDGPIAGKAVIDARGLVIAPGFIDLHAHDHSALTHKLHAQDGVTSAFELENGTYPVADWYRRREGRSSINFGVSASHGAIRAIAMNAADAGDFTGETDHDQQLATKVADWADQPTTLTQRHQMDRLIRSQLRDGAVGIGYHLAGTPGADYGEMLHFYGLSAEERVPNFVHIRSVGQVAPAEAAAEVVKAAELTGASIHVVHVNSSGLWDTAEVLSQLDAARAKGMDVTTEAYPYTGAESSLDDPRMLDGLKMWKMDYGDLQLVSTGERLTKESYELHKSRTPHGGLIAHIMKQSDVDLAIAHPGTIIASDGGMYVDGKGHPRSAGTFARIFAYYVRERKMLSLMEAIRRVSYLPAKRLEPFVPSMRDRGRIRPGAYADITIFDPTTIADRATYADSALPSKGIAYVVVNGTLVVSNYEFVEGAHPGLPIRASSK